MEVCNDFLYINPVDGDGLPHLDDVEEEPARSWTQEDGASAADILVNERARSIKYYPDLEALEDRTYHSG